MTTMRASDAAITRDVKQRLEEAARATDPHDELRGRYQAHELCTVAFVEGRKKLQRVFFELFRRRSSSQRGVGG